MTSNFKIGTRILAGYLLALAIFAVVGGVIYHSLVELVNDNDWVTHTHKVKEALANILLSMVNAETGQRGYLITGEEQYLATYEAGVRTVDTYFQEVRQLTMDNPRQQRRLDELQPIIARRTASLAQVVAIRGQGDQAAARIALIDRGKADMDEIRRRVTEMDNEENELLNFRDTADKQTANLALNSVWIGGLAAAGLVIILSLLIQRSITGPLTAFVGFTQRVGSGDLTQRSENAGRDELGELSRSLDGMVLGLKDVAKQTNVVTEDLNAAAAEILASTQQQAASTAEQAAAVQQANATMSELSQSGAQISDRARQVATAAEAVSTASASGLQSVQNTNNTMESIRQQAEAVAGNVIALSEKTQAISDIIATVNDIAEQSHLLALNASIQAAAAGEHGRSFSVVASEMKSLAGQSKQATVQVRSILGDIQKGITTSVMLTEEAVKRVESGKQHANLADQTMRKLSENLEESIRAFQQIVAGSAQQQIGFEQVTQAFRNIGLASQETASSTRQSEKAAAHLSTLSKQLRDSVSRYRV